MGFHNVYRMIEQPSGDIWIRAYPSEERRAADPIQPGWITRDYDSADALEQVLPRVGNTVDRSRRGAWRWQGGRVISDPAVPDPPHPKQALLDEVGAATTIAALRAAILKLIRP